MFVMCQMYTHHPDPLSIRAAGWVEMINPAYRAVELKSKKLNQNVIAIRKNVEIN